MRSKRLLQAAGTSSSRPLRHRQTSITKGLLTLPKPEVTANGKTLPNGLVMSPEPNAPALGLRSKGVRR
jgi:hypothetical protein